MTSKNRLLWVDLEMSGLNVDSDVILECAAVLTTYDASHVIGSPLHFIIHQSDKILESMNEWSKQQHQKSGLTEASKKSDIFISDVDKRIASFLHEYECQSGTLLLSGNSVWQDRVFIVKYMPLTAHFLHYRIIDVSTVKELVQRWYPEHDQSIFVKKDTHRAVDDIYESINELKHYKKYFFNTM